MSNDFTNVVTPNEQVPGSSRVGAPGKTSHRIRNNQKWDSLKDRIYHIYMSEDFTLHDTMRTIAERYGLKASERKWKKKLKEWRFEKNISASDMSIIVAKAEKRVREEGKETIFFHGQSKITQERIEQFKRRKTTKAVEEVFSRAATPENIMYHTPRPNWPENLSIEALEQSRKSIRATDPVSSNYRLPGNKESLTTGESERVQSLVAVETCLTEGGNKEETIQDIPRQDDHLTEAVDYGSAYIPDEDASNADQCPFELESTGNAPSRGSICVAETGWTPDNSSSCVSPQDKQVDSLSAKFSTKLSLHVSTTRRGRVMSETLLRISESVQDTRTGNLYHHANSHRRSQTRKDSESVQESSCGSQSDYSTSQSGTSSISEHDSQTSVSSGTSTPASEAAVKEALALRAEGNSIDSILLKLECGSSEICSKFCQNLWKVCSSFEKNNRLEEASIALDLIQVGYTRVFGSQSIHAIHCMVHRARVLRKRKEYKDSELVYRQAINGLRNLRETKSQLTCQLFLADFLKSLNKLSEALFLLLETLIEHFNPRTASIKMTVPEVMGSMQRLHLKMDTDQNMIKVMASITQLQELQSEWPEPYHEFKVWAAFVRLGVCYSEVGKFDMAELCFSYIRPAGYEGTNPLLKLELARFHKERSLHDRRQGRVVDSVIQLKLAFKHLISVEPPDEYDQSVAIELEQILGEFVSKEMQVAGNDALQIALEQARDTFRLFAAGQRAKELKQREMIRCEELASPSSHDSPRFSTDSASSGIGVTYSGGSESSMVSNSALMVSS